MTRTSLISSRARLHEHDGSLHDMLDTLGRGLAVKSIMTPWRQVDAVQAPSNNPDTKTAAMTLMDRHQYSAVPLVSSGQVLGVYVRHNPGAQPCFENARPEHFVQPELGLFDLVRQMRDTRKIAICIGEQTAPIGWLTYADLSKRPFRVLLFALMAEIEYLLALALDTAHPDGSWIDLLSTGSDEARDHRSELLRRKEQAQHWDVMMPLTTFAEIGPMIHALALSSPALELLGESAAIADRLKAIPDMRNRVAHVVKPIVAGPGQIKVVADQIDMMLGWIDAWSARLSAVSPEVSA